MTNPIKYPRTPHALWSQGRSEDDIEVVDLNNFIDKEIIILEKIDGENASLYHDYYHARSLDSRHHPSRSWIKSFHASISNDIPNDIRICGENVYAFHSIFYTNLPSYFLVFGIYNENNVCLSWDDTIEYCELLGLCTVPVLYEGIFDEEYIKSFWKGIGKYPTFSDKDRKIPCDAEGYVVRLRDQFHYDDFDKSCFKYVRKNHVQTDEHWMSKPVVPNLLNDDVLGT